METENVNKIAETMAKSLDDTQKKATDISSSVTDIQSLSEQEIHEQIVQSILNDNDIGIEKKLAYIHRENSRYDRRLENNAKRVMRLQETQMKNVGNATAHWRQPFIGFMVGIPVGMVVVIATIPESREIVTSIAKQLIV